MSRRPLVWGHRGTRRGAPENTLAAMDLSLAQGADGIELDVRLCRTGEVIVLHDPDLARMAGSPVAVAHATLTEVRSHDLGAGERVPLLDEAIDLVLGRGATLNVELKPDVPDRDALVAAVVSRLAARREHEREQILLSSFSRELCEALHAALPRVRTAFLYERATPGLEDALPRGVSAVHPLHTLVDDALVASSHARGLKLHVWTVNEASRALELIQSGVDAIITDDVPAILAARDA